MYIYHMHEAANHRSAQDFLDEYMGSVLAGQADVVNALVQEARESGLSPERIYLEIFAPAQRRIGELWHQGRVSIAEEHRASELTLAAMEQLKSRVRPLTKTGYRAIVCGVEGELHTIGAKVVADFLYFEGWDVHFLGGNLPLSELIEFARKVQPHLVALSVNTVENVIHAKSSVEALKRLTPAPKVFLGGALTQEKKDMLDKLGSDGVMKNANEVVENARELVGLGDPELTLSSYLKELGGRIHTFRKARSMSQQQLADSADLDRTYISAVEHGKQNVTVGAIVKLSGALKIPLRQLLVGPVE